MSADDRLRMGIAGLGRMAAGMPAISPPVSPFNNSFPYDLGKPPLGLRIEETQILDRTGQAKGPIPDGSVGRHAAHESVWSHIEIEKEFAAQRFDPTGNGRETTFSFGA